MSDLFNEEIISQATHTKWAANRPFCKRNRFHKPRRENVPGGKKAQDTGSCLWQNISPQDADVLQDDGVRRRTVPLL